jgi:vancomycin resistance protein VanW
MGFCFVFFGGDMRKNNNLRQKPRNRSRFRNRFGMVSYGLLRRASWLIQRNHFAQQHVDPLTYVQVSHQTPLLRQLKDVDMKYQYNKIVNLRIAAKKLDGIVIHPGEIFSYWKLIGSPTKRKGYLDGMVLHNGQVGYGIGGGLCQLSNLIFWMALHSPLTVVERHRHGYDVFPDSDRTQPFGSGATCCYPHVDLMLQNNTPNNFQLSIKVQDEFLTGAWRTDAPPLLKYQVVEKNHRIVAEYWGGYTRCNELYRRTYDCNGNLQLDEKVAENNAIMMYAPFIESPA